MASRCPSTTWFSLWAHARRPEAVPGLSEHGVDLYTVSGAEAAHRALVALPSGGEVLFLVASTPFKCPPAPYEAAMLARAFLDDHGNPAARVTLATPEPQPLPVAGAECGAAVREWIEERSVEYLPGRAIASVERGVARFADGSARRFDLLVAVPPHRPPRVLGDAFVPADPGTLATGRRNVWAVGDCNVVMLANGKLLVKAGMMAEGEGAVVARNIAARVRGEREAARFDGRGSCYLELGHGLAVEVEGDFYAKPHPVVAATGPPSAAALERKEAFERERLERWFGA